MNQYVFEAILNITILISALLGSAFAMFVNQTVWINYGESFAAGSFTGLTLFNMLPYIADQYSVLVVTSLIILFLIDFIARRSKPQSLQALLFKEQSSIAVPYFDPDSPLITLIVTFTLLVLSSILLGFSLGLTDPTLDSIILAVVISAQKFFEVMILGIQIRHRNKPSVLSWVTLFVYSLITPISAVLTSIFLKGKPNIHWLRAVASSVYLFMGFSYWYKEFFCPYEYRRYEIWILALLFACGLIIMAIPAITSL